MGHLGFSYVGMIFLLMLFVPNIIWARKLPQDYSSKGESRLLGFLERVGEVMTTCCALCFQDFNIRLGSARIWWLVAAFVVMLLYECWWVRYFRSRRTLLDFYSSLLGVPVAGATLPVIAALLLGIYGRVIWMLIAATILGIGHIGIHLGHRRDALQGKEEA